ncbi:MAG: DUF5063 domain-containing protein [Bacteroidales bacterium]|nr:DUF5063 domain-containing protein [Bacteroidales bacterium]
MVENIDNEEIVKSKTVIEVIAVATEYCLFIESIERYDSQERLPFLQKILTALYLKGLLFPSVEVSDDAYNERFVTEEEYELIRLKLSNCFSDIDFFSVVDFIDNQSDTKIISFSELLADIYLDLKDFLLLYRSGSLAAQENAVAACKDYFDDNWGYKLTILLPYMHYLSMNH